MNPKVVIFCGGEGTRLREHTEVMPKPLVPVGEMPILWHIMKIYSHYGFNDFIMCLGYKGDLLKNYFLNYQYHSSDIQVHTKLGQTIRQDADIEDWKINLTDTGLYTNTGGRLKRIKKYLAHDPYCLVTYGDGVADINIPELIKFHQDSKKIITITGVKPTSKYGQIQMDDTGRPTFFEQKPKLNDVINGGFMVINREFLDYIKNDSDPIEAPFSELAKNGQLGVYKHEGFWHCMDTHRDLDSLNKIWQSGKVPWKIWET